MTRTVAYLTNQLLDWTTRQPRFGGGERYCLTLGQLLRDHGLEVVFFQVGDEPFEGEYFGFPVVALAPSSEQFSEFQYGVCNAFYERAGSFDHVIYNLPNYASGRVHEDGILMMHAVSWDHDVYGPPMEYRTPEWFEHLHAAFSRLRRVVSVDTNAINVIRSLWPELTPRMTFIPNWVDPAEFFPPVVSRATTIAAPLILIPRRIEVVRGSRVFGPMVERIRADCRIVWVGSGDPLEVEHLHEIARRDSRVSITSASFAEMPQFYRDADLCVIPTLASEGTSLSCLEAMASGCAVVTTYVGGLANLVQDGRNGRLCDPTAESMAAAINELLDDRQELARIQREGVRAATHYTLEIWRERWIRVLRELGWI